MDPELQQMVTTIAETIIKEKLEEKTLDLILEIKMV